MYSGLAGVLALRIGEACGARGAGRKERIAGAYEFLFLALMIPEG